MLDFELLLERIVASKISFIYKFHGTWIMQGKEGDCYERGRKMSTTS